MYFNTTRIYYANFIYEYIMHRYTTTNAMKIRYNE